MRCLLSLLIVLALCVPLAATERGKSFIALSYHDVQDNIVDDLDPDRVAVSTSNLFAQFSWLREHGYHPVSLNDIVAAHRGERSLPDKAVLLTFDDGLKSAYTRVFPLLKMFDYPAVLAIMGRWLEAGPNEAVPYGNKQLKRDRFLTWSQLREMNRSGLVEVAAHSYDLHRAVQGNPQGNVQPMLVTREYDPKTGTYQDPDSHQKLVHRDMNRIVSLLEKRIGVKPRCMVWPYGLDNAMAREEAAAAGMSITLNLGQCVNSVSDVSRICRILVQENPKLEDFVWDLQNFDKIRDPIRVVQVDLDYIFDPDKEQQKRNLDILLDRIKEMQINTVYLQAFSDSDLNGAAEALYFPNRHLPVREDLFNRVAWQLRTRAGVNVYAWMPVLSFELPDKELTENLMVRKWEKGETVPNREGYQRLSPFHPEARRIIEEIYEDLAAHAFFMGLLFHDDAILSDFEDAGDHAMETYRTDWGLEGDLDAIRNDPERFKHWSRLKAEILAGFTDDLTERVRSFRPDIKTARNIYAVAVLDPRAMAWMAQSMDLFLKHYDYTAVMAMPYMEKARNPEKWLERLVRAVDKHKDGLKKTVFELQSVHWEKQEKLPAALLTRHMGLIQRLGAVNFGYYPDDFIAGIPLLEEIKAGISLNSYPYTR